GGAAAAGDPIAYVTNFAGQGAVARLVYRGDRRSIEERYNIAAAPGWASADLSAAAGGAAAAGDPIAYVTNFAGQGAVARLVYRGVNRHIYELYNIAAAPGWASADLSAAAGGAAAAGDPIAYVTNFAGQGAVARLVYR